MRGWTGVIADREAEYRDRCLSLSRVKETWIYQPVAAGSTGKERVEESTAGCGC